MKTECDKSSYYIAKSICDNVSDNKDICENEYDMCEDYILI
jgi:hypothetical protein